MAKLCNIRQRLDDLVMLTTPFEGTLPPMGCSEIIQQKIDDNFVILAVASPTGPKTSNTELLRISIDDRVIFTWPVSALHDRYARFVCGMVPEELRELHQAIRVIGLRVREAWDKERELIDRESWQHIQETHALSSLLSSYMCATSHYLAEPGVKLQAAIPIPPRATIKAEASEGSKVTVYLRGMRGRDL